MLQWEKPDSHGSFHLICVKNTNFINFICLFFTFYYLIFGVTFPPAALGAWLTAYAGTACSQIRHRV